jgi:stage V sporulation protein G
MSMNITEIRIALGAEDDQPVRAYCSVSFDNCLAIHDVRLLQVGDRMFVAMPNRKRTAPCLACQSRNTVESRYCNYCGNRLAAGENRDPADGAKKFFDIAHPLTREFREELETELVKGYLQQKQLGQ